MVDGWMMWEDREAANVWHSVTVRDGKLVDHGPPITELKVGDQVWTMGLIGAHYMEVQEDPDHKCSDTGLILFDGTNLAPLRRNSRGEFYTDIMFNTRAVKRLDV